MAAKMVFGEKAKNLKSMRKDMQKRKERGGGLSFIGENGLNVRFLLEPEEWTRYSEAYSPSMRKGWPVPNGEEVEVDDAKVSLRYAATALDIDNDRVIVVKLPISLADLLSARAEKRGTLLDVDLEIYKSGEGLNTVYGFDVIDKTDRDLDKYEDDLPDPGKILAKEYLSVWGEDDDDEDDDEEEEAPKPKRRGAAAASPKRRTTKPLVEDEEDEEDLDDEEEDEDLEDEEEEDLEDEEEDEDEEEAEEDGEAWTRPELEDLTIAELRAIAVENDIDTKGLKKSQLVDAIMGDDAF